MDFNHRHLGPALGAQWTFAFCKLLILKDWSGRFEPSTSWSRSSRQNHISRCPGVTYWFSGRSLMDKSGQAITECSRELWGIDSKAARPTTLRLTAEEAKNLIVASGVACGKFGAILTSLVPPNPAPNLTPLHS